MNRRFLTRLLSVAVLAFVALPVAAQTAFTYQGQLKDAGSPANGAYDMVFRLFDADVGGNQIGADFLAPGVTVTNGLFTAPLDFGAVFTALPLWLELEVNTVVLTPRQGLSATPFAQTSSFATYAATSGSSGPWLLNGLDTYYVDGSVGIGTASPIHPLTLHTPTHAYGFSHTDGTIDMVSFIGGGGNGGYLGTKSNHPMHLYANDSDPLLTVHPNRNIGIGTIAPASKLDIVATGDGAELLRFNTERPWVFRQTGTGSGAFLRLQSTVGLKEFQVTAAGGTNVAIFHADDANPMVTVNGLMRAKVVQITGADLAEKFPTSDKTARPGTVMEIDPDHAGQLRVARGAYNQRVAGVVSGANDFPAGAILGHMEGNENAPAIALSGRVWVQCDAGDSPIFPGDLLTTAKTPGHAMKASDRERSHGAVIGKAMTALKSGRGLVLVLVNLQ